MYEGYDTSECMLCDLFHNSTTAAADYNGCVRVLNGGTCEMYHATMRIF